MLPRRLAMWVAFPFGRDADGRPLCRYCGDAVVSPRQSWCSDACVEAAKIECGDGGIIRAALFRQDHGVCQICSADTEALGVEFVQTHEFGRAVQRWRGDAAVLDGLVLKGFIRDLSLWQADHVVPVAEGGGGCGIEGYRTLCRPCHVRATAELRTRLANEARRARCPELVGTEVREPHQIGLPLAALPEELRS